VRLISYHYTTIYSSLFKVATSKSQASLCFVIWKGTRKSLQFLATNVTDLKAHLLPECGVWFPVCIKLKIVWQINFSLWFYMHMLQREWRLFYLP